MPIPNIYNFQHTLGQIFTQFAIVFHIFILKPLLITYTSKFAISFFIIESYVMYIFKPNIDFRWNIKSPNTIRVCLKTLWWLMTNHIRSQCCNHRWEWSWGVAKNLAFTKFDPRIHMFAQIAFILHLFSKQIKREKPLLNYS